MKVRMTADHMAQIEKQGEASYPDEGGGFLLGDLRDGEFVVRRVMSLDNEWAEGSQRNRFGLTGDTSLKAEFEAARHDMSVIGVFHSHPDHPAEPSKWDLEWATWPNFSFLITTVAEGKAAVTRAWRLADDRQSYEEDTIQVTE